MDNLVPKLVGVNLLAVDRIVRTDRVLLCVLCLACDCLHEFVVDLYRYVGSGYLSFCHLGIDESLCIGVFDRDAEHECTTAAILCYLACRVRVTLHERNKAC